MVSQSQKMLIEITIIVIIFCDNDIIRNREKVSQKIFLLCAQHRHLVRDLTSRMQLKFLKNSKILPFISRS